MKEWKKDSRKEAMIVDIDMLVPKDHLLRKIESIMEYEWIYERLNPYYCHTTGRPSIDPVVLIKMVLIQHLFGIPSLRQTHREIEVNVAYRWFLGYNLIETIPHFTTVSHAFCHRFPQELTDEIFERILEMALNRHMVKPEEIFIDGTHIKASANKRKSIKQQVSRTAKIYSRQLQDEINEERARLGKKPIEDKNDDDENNHSGGGSKEITMSTTDPESGMFVKGEHERQFAYEAHTACDKNGIVLAVQVTAGNIHDSVAWDGLYDEVTEKYNSTFIVMDAGYKTPWIAKKILDDGRMPVLPYTRSKKKKTTYKLWQYKYDSQTDTYSCPHGGILYHTTTNKEGRRTYRSIQSHCANCPHKALCGANARGQKMLQSHIWQEYLDAAEQIRLSQKGKAVYEKRKESIERVFADAKERHAMRYTHHRGLTCVTRWVKLKFAAMNLKKIAAWSSKPSFLLDLFCCLQWKNPVFAF